MILDLIEGLKQVLQDEWDIPVFVEAKEELGVETPNFFIFVLSSEEKSLMSDRCIRQIPVEIHYHPDEPVDLPTCYDIAERLFEITNLVSLSEGFTTRGQNKKFELTQNTIIFRVSFDFVLSPDKAKEEAMETVESQTVLGG